MPVSIVPTCPYCRISGRRHPLAASFDEKALFICMMCGHRAYFDGVEHTCDCFYCSGRGDLLKSGT